MRTLKPVTTEARAAPYAGEPTRVTKAGLRALLPTTLTEQHCGGRGTRSRRQSRLCTIAWMLPRASTWAVTPSTRTW